ncbi:MAG TPA: hypothetical protein VFQ53_19210 [Kofleriaceae bacterium]|nr:hypothetical protein [Kofleriaceae bacterium]
MLILQRIAPFIIVFLLVAFAMGCFITTRGRAAPRRECPPSYHWEDGDCVHNGKAKGHEKHKKHKH